MEALKRTPEEVVKDVVLASSPQVQDEVEDATTVLDEFSVIPSSSISSKLRMGYFSMDRACQTEISDIISLKDTTELLAKLVKEIKLLKKDLYYTKLSLQADYESNIQSRAVELYKRINSGVNNLEKVHDKRLHTIRHSFRTELANAIQRISQEYNNFYRGVSEQQKELHQKEVNDIQRLQQEQRRAQVAQQDLIDMMKLQMDTGGDGYELENEDNDIPKSPSPPPVAQYIQEIEELKENAVTLELKIEELEESLQEANKKRKNLASELERAKRQYVTEQKRGAEAKREMMELQILLENERKATKSKLERQKVELQTKLQNELTSAQQKAQLEAQRKIEELEAKQADKLREQQLLEQKKLDDFMQSQVQEKTPEPVENDDIALLRRIEKKQRQEIARLQRELERANKTAEAKISALQQSLHALKDEMFLRVSLQRQTTKLQHLGVSYLVDGPKAVITKVDENELGAPIRKHQLPKIIQGPSGKLGPLPTRPLTAGAVDLPSEALQRPESLPTDVAL